MLELVRDMEYEGSAMRTAETISTLNGLIRVCRGAEARCQSWVAIAQGTALRRRLEARAGEWGRQGDELQALVLLLGGEPARGTSFAALLHRLWSASRAVLLGRSDLPVARALDWTQQQALEWYERALEGYLPERIRRTVGLHARHIAARCERLGAGSGHFASP